MPRNQIHPVSLIAVAMLFILVASCKKKSSFPKDDIRYFKDLLEAGMDNGDVLDALGEPTTDLNKEFASQDGLHIYQYQLSDSSFVRIGVTDQIKYACLVDIQDNLLEDIIDFSTGND
jgi:hypothetical protein